MTYLSHSRFPTSATARALLIRAPLTSFDPNAPTRPSVDQAPPVDASFTLTHDHADHGGPGGHGQGHAPLAAHTAGMGERINLWLARALIGATLLAPTVVIARDSHGAHGGHATSNATSNVVSGNAASAARAVRTMHATPSSAHATRIVHGGSNCLRRDEWGNCVNYGYSAAPAVPMPAAGGWQDGAAVP